jgi:hypothetical protein
MNQVEPLETQSQLPTAAALDLLAKYRSTLCQLDNTGSYEEADLVHVAARIRKVAAVLVPDARLTSVLMSIDNALLISVEDRTVEQSLGSVFPGPFLLNRAKRLIRVTDALRDDIVLGRLGPKLSDPAQHCDDSEPPPPAKWVAWCWSNRRKRSGFVILIVLMAVAWYLLTIYTRLPHIAH